MGLGLFTIGFVVYQLWITGIFTAAAQDRLDGELDERLSTVEVIAAPVQLPADAPQLPDAVSLALAANPSPLPDGGLPPSSGVPGAVDDDPTIRPRGDQALSRGVATVLTEDAPLLGEVGGRIVVPSIDLDWAFVEGVGRDQLRLGPGHMPETAFPGQPGNAVVSGHRTTYGAPFRPLDKVEAGDLVIVETASGRHEYEVVTTLIVAPDDTWVLDQWAGAWLTLTTCNPVGSAAERLVVVARLVGGPNAEAVGALPVN